MPLDSTLPRMTNETNDKPWFEEIGLPVLLRHARTTYGAAMRKALDEAGYDDIPGNGLYVIGGLALGVPHIPLSQLIKELRISKQAGGQLVDGLVTRGYLERAVDKEDRRKLTVTLTERGKAAAAAKRRRARSRRRTACQRGRRRHQAHPPDAGRVVRHRPAG